jgi:hypothetical protein
VLDIRYHTVSLVAVFLALGLGILIGTIVVQDPDLLRAQDAVIQKLSTDLEALDAQNEQSRERIARLEQSKRELEGFAEEVLPLLVANRLFGRHIAVVGTHDPALEGLLERVRGVLAEMQSVFEDAGLTLESPRLSGDGSAAGGGSASSDSAASGGATTRGAAADAVARILVDSAIIGYDALMTPALLETQCLSIDDTLKTAADSVVVISDSAGSASSHMQALLPLLDDLASRGILFVIVTESGGTWRLSEEADRAETVSGLDTAPGRYSLVMALAGERRRSASD